MEVVDQEENSVDHDGDSIDSDSDSSGHVWQEKRRLKDEQLRVLGSAYQTVIVILQDLVSSIYMYAFMHLCIYVCICVYVCMYVCRLQLSWKSLSIVWMSS